MEDAVGVSDFLLLEKKKLVGGNGYIPCVVY